MKARNYLVIMSTMILMVIGLMACGKGSNPVANTTDNTTGATTSEIVNAAVLNDTPATTTETTEGITYVSTPLGQLPALPTESRSLSATVTLPATVNGDQVKKIGESYVMSEGCTIEGTALVMDSGDRTKRKIAWAMYEVGGFDPKSDQQLSMASKYWLDQDRFDVNKSGYFIAVSNFTRKSWEWHGPFKVPETEFALHPKQIHTSVSGYLYFMIVVFDGDKGTHELTTIMEGSAIEPTELPAPSKLVASDGKHSSPIEAAGVQLSWEASDGALMYIVERRLVLQDNSDTTKLPEQQWHEIGRTPELGFFDPMVVPNQHYHYRVYANNKNQRSPFSNVDEGWWAGEVLPPPVDGKIVGLRVSIADAITKKEFGMFVTPKDNSAPDLKNLVVPANTHLAGRVVTVFVQIVKEDGTMTVIERQPTPNDRFGWLTDGPAFPDKLMITPELRTVCAPDTLPENPTEGIIVCTILPKDFDISLPYRPIPENLKSLPAVVIPTRLILDDRASNVKEVYTYENAKLNPEATQYFYFRVGPEFVPPIKEFGEINIAPELILTPVIATELPGRPFEIDFARPHIILKYCPEARTVPTPGYFTAYAWPWNAELKEWKFKAAYSPEICPLVPADPSNPDAKDQVRALPHGLYRIRFMNNVGFNMMNNPLDPGEPPRPGDGSTTPPPAYGPEKLDNQFHLHRGNIFLPVKGIIAFD